MEPISINPESVKNLLDNLEVKTSVPFISIFKIIRKINYITPSLMLIFKASLHQT